MIIRKVAPALADEVGIPAGVLQVVAGDTKKISAAMCESTVVYGGCNC